ncbi:MAG: zf-HC2 domain-containing protein [Calditrichaceae bacterium]
MNNCNKYKDLMIKLISSEISKADKKRLDAHLESCPSCKEILMTHKTLMESADILPLPSSTDFTGLRQNVLRKIRLSQSKETFTVRLTRIFTRIEFAYALAAVFLISGLYVFYNTNRTTGKIPSDFIEQIDYSAQQNTTLTDMTNSPYNYSNVEIKEMDDQQIRLGFNVSTYIELTRRKDDPLVKEILAQSILNSNQTGSRLTKITYAENILDPKLKETLIYVLQNDPVLAVRLKALEILTKYAIDDELKKAFLKILRHEESVQMRLTVLEYLMHNKVDANLISEELNSATTRINQPVMLKAQGYTNFTNKPIK